MRTMPCLLVVLALASGDLDPSRRLDDPGSVDPAPTSGLILGARSGVGSLLEATSTGAMKLRATMGMGFEGAPMRPMSYSQWIASGLDGANADAAFSMTAPATFAFAAPSPNPFDRTTRLGFDLPAPSRVRVESFDVRGRKVLSAPVEELSAGRYQRTWAGHDGLGHPLPPGIYLVRLEASPVDGQRPFAAVRKILKLR